MGLAMARRFCEEGANVVVSSRKQEGVDEALAYLRDAGFRNVTGMASHQAKAADRTRLIAHTVATFGTRVRAPPRAGGRHAPAPASWATHARSGGGGGGVRVRVREGVCVHFHSKLGLYLRGGRFCLTTGR